MKKFLSSLPIILLFLLLEVPAIIYKQWGLVTLFTIFGILFGITEVVIDKWTGETVSQHMWKLKRQNKKGALIIVICMALAWALLIFHFWAHS